MLQIWRGGGGGALKFHSSWKAFQCMSATNQLDCSGTIMILYWLTHMQDYHTLLGITFFFKVVSHTEQNSMVKGLACVKKWLTTLSVSGPVTNAANRYVVDREQYNSPTWKGVRLNYNNIVCLFTIWVAMFTHSFFQEWREDRSKVRMGRIPHNWKQYCKNCGELCWSTTNNVTISSPRRMKKGLAHNLWIMGNGRLFAFFLCLTPATYTCTSVSLRNKAHHSFASIIEY